VADDLVGQRATTSLVLEKLRHLSKKSKTRTKQEENKKKQEKIRKNKKESESDRNNVMSRQDRKEMRNNGNILQ
jgi:rRNA-processing protein FCF1